MQMMNRSMYAIWIAVMFITLLLTSESVAQEWRGIKVLQSTCDDVKTGLGVEKCEYPRSVFRLKEETVTISFQMCPCPILCYHQSGGWNVAPGTVGSIIRQLYNPAPVSDFGVDSGKWTTTNTDLVGHVIYNSREQGMSLSVINGKVVTITYYPDSDKDKNKDLLCAPCTVPEPTAADGARTRSSWFTAYENLNPNEEEKRLDTFADKLKAAKDSIGYIVAYDSCRAMGEAKGRAERAKKYLVSTKGIGGDRIVILDAGQREQVSIELHVRMRSEPPPRIVSSTYPKAP